MPINPRPTKSLNQRPVKQLENVPQNTASVQNSGSFSFSRPIEPLTKNAVLPPQSSDPAFMGQKAPIVANSTAVPNVYGSNPIMLFVEQMKDMVSSFATLSDDVISQNVKMALGGFSADDRSLSYEIADYLMANMGFIFMGLVLDNNFKNAFKESLNVELRIDSQPDNIKAATRAKMHDSKKYKTRGAMIIGTSDFVPEVKAALTKKMQMSFSALDGFADEFDTEIKHLTREQKMEYGFIFSNFMYLIRAFTHNDLFMSYVISVIEKVKAVTMTK